MRALIATLNRGMAGAQSPASAPLRYRFLLKKIDYTKNDGWYHAYLFGKRDTQAKRKLHRGGARTLNLFINGGGPRNEPLLGWSRFPWQYHVTPKLDSVTVNAASMSGGSAHGYNLGDTMIHEVGHWLGLFHTFQGGCGGNGDLRHRHASGGGTQLQVPRRTRHLRRRSGCDPILQLHGLLL